MDPNAEAVSRKWVRSVTLPVRGKQDMSQGMAAGRFIGREYTGQAALRERTAGRKSMRCCKTEKKRAPQEHDAEPVRPDRRHPHGMPSRDDLVRMEKPVRAACCSCITMRDGGVQRAPLSQRRPNHAQQAA